MHDILHNERCSELEILLAPMAAEVTVKALHWITLPTGGMHESDDGYDWCEDCADKKIAELRAADPEHADEYILDGGWGGHEAESLAHCVGCHCHLRVTLLKYGVYEELAYYRENGFSTKPEEDAYALENVLAGIAYHGEDDAWAAAEAVQIAERFALENGIDLPAPPVPGAST